MDMKLIGNFLKELRKEKGITQEQLAEIMGVAGRTVSRWETASNMPDLSLLLQLAEFYKVDVGELLDGKRKEKASDNEEKELLNKISDYNETKEKKYANICNKVLLITFVLLALTLVAQLMMYGNIKYVIGEIIAIMIGGSIVIFMSVKNGLWNIASKQKATPFRDIITSGVVAVVFTIASASLIFSKTSNYKITAVFSLIFFVIVFTLGFVVLRILAKASKKNENT